MQEVLQSPLDGSLAGAREVAERLPPASGDSRS